MTVTLIAPVVDITLAAPAPYLVLACSLTPPTPAAPQEGVIVVPVPPGVDYDTLPTINPETQIIDTSPDQVIGCANALYAGVEQDILNHLYPSAIAGDGVIDRSTNNFWVYDGSTWNNVGPNPGPTVINTPVLPPWDVVQTYDARVRTRLEVESLAYGLELLTEPAPYGVSVGLITQRVMPTAQFIMGSVAPIYVGTLATILQPPLIQTSVQAASPSILITDPLQPVIFSMDGEDGDTFVTSIDSNSIAAVFFGDAQLDTSTKKWGASSLQLDGVEDFIEFETPYLLGTQDFTVEFWVYIPSSASGFGTFAMIGDLYSIDYDADLDEINYYQAVEGNGIVHQNTLTRDTWHHVAIYRLSNTAYLAVDGVVSDTPTPETHDFADPVNRLGDWDGDGSFTIECYLDDYRVTPLVSLYGELDFTPPSGPFVPGDLNMEFDIPAANLGFTVSALPYVGTLATVIQPPLADQVVTAMPPLINTSVVLTIPTASLDVAGREPAPVTSQPPQLIGSSSVVASISALSIDVSGIYDTNDILLLVAETSGDASDAVPDSILLPDWNVVPNTPVTDLSTSAGSKLQVWWCRASSPTVYSNIDFPDTGDHQIAKIFVIRGCATTGDPWNATSSIWSGDSNTSAVGAALNTTTAQTLIFSAVTHPVDTTSTTQFGTPSNSILEDLTDVGEVSTDQGNGGGFVVATGVKKLSGDTGFIIYFSAPNAPHASVSIAFKP